ncbi:anti-phage dCTP deaminase [Pseudomonas sp. NBRC 100443]|uniref:anti-phage dCTP deaminase n=1 Tax=Pseudomonas sp. NBRC 100443 TaxID=1113665 RepID=UPI0024A37C07|nr:anti-phage dCTP deaminase [Pseudomonas sp. NBRC 100443]GLU39777.1 cytidine deaminase [Pseudomonas sp. NBRC 100443]
MDIHEHSANCELVIGIVSPVGINLDDVHNRIESLFKQFNYKINLIHLSKLGNSYGDPLREGASELERLDNGMNNGKLLREKYNRDDFYALLAIDAIYKLREKDVTSTAPLFRNVHLIRSLKNPDEVETLRNVYGDGFFLIGVSSSIENRKRYLENLKGIPKEELDRLISRDDKESADHGQRTRDVFQMADAFVTTDDAERLSDQLSRILNLLFSNPLTPPTAEEYAMFMAYAASLRSADLSRQVGAVISSTSGDIVSTGANDVPKFGGGLYWPDAEDKRDYRLGKDFNEAEKQKIIIKIMKKLPGNEELSDEELIENGRHALKDTGLLDITEYGRAVHAEMEAILSAGRNGVSVKGATLYTTTYPCHNCAKHIVAAGISRVKYVEPYPKSYATMLHDDSIDAESSSKANKAKQTKVKFEPFVGIGPRKFVDLFSMNLSSGRKIKRKDKGNVISWARRDAELRVPMRPLSYLDAEIILVNELASITEMEAQEAK